MGIHGDKYYIYILNNLKYKIGTKFYLVFLEDDILVQKILNLSRRRRPFFALMNDSHQLVIEKFNTLFIWNQP